MTCSPASAAIKTPYSDRAAFLRLPAILLKTEQR
jgi:hypothetical protein